MVHLQYAKKEICSNSVMWQSDRWLSVVASVYSFTSPHSLHNHPLILALKLFFRRRHYKLIVTVGPTVTFIYGLLCRLFCVAPKQVVLELLLDEPENSFFWSIKHRLKLMVMRRVSGVVVASREEIRLLSQRYGLPQEAVRFLPWHTNIIKPQISDEDEGYIFSAGRSLRDYKLLIEACHGIKKKVVIVCGNADLTDVDIPANVTVKREVKRDEYLKLMRRASFVVVPLLPVCRSTGQVVILEAMSFGKAVITLDCVGTRDYVTDGVDSLLYNSGDVESLRSCIMKLLSDGDLRRQLGRSGYQSVMERYTVEAHVEAKIRILEHFLGKDQGNG